MLGATVGCGAGAVPEAEEFHHRGISSNSTLLDGGRHYSVKWIGHAPSEVPYDCVSARCVFEYWREKHEHEHYGADLAAAVLLSEGAMARSGVASDAKVTSRSVQAVRLLDDLTPSDEWDVDFVEIARGDVRVPTVTDCVDGATPPLFVFAQNGTKPVRKQARGLNDEDAMAVGRYLYRRRRSELYGAELVMACLADAGLVVEECVDTELGLTAAAGNREGLSVFRKLCLLAGVVPPDVQ